MPPLQLPQPTGVCALDKVQITFQVFLVFDGIYGLLLLVTLNSKCQEEILNLLYLMMHWSDFNKILKNLVYQINARPPTWPSHAILATIWNLNWQVWKQIFFIECLAPNVLINFNIGHDFNLLLATSSTSQIYLV